tara:strand:+ start:636 stop:869 length:234 start_codon:yes stop_codon:yes gene_type:complete
MKEVFNFRIKESKLDDFEKIERQLNKAVERVTKDKKPKKVLFETGYNFDDFVNEKCTIRIILFYDQEQTRKKHYSMA